MKPTPSAGQIIRSFDVGFAETLIVRVNNGDYSNAFSFLLSCQAGRKHDPETTGRTVTSPSYNSGVRLEFFSLSSHINPAMGCRDCISEGISLYSVLLRGAEQSKRFTLQR